MSSVMRMAESDENVVFAGKVQVRPCDTTSLALGGHVYGRPATSGAVDLVPEMYVCRMPTKRPKRAVRSERLELRVAAEDRAAIERATRA